MVGNEQHSPLSEFGQNVTIMILPYTRSDSGFDRFVSYVT
jgi:hypothetical protein